MTNKRNGRGKKKEERKKEERKKEGKKEKKEERKKEGRILGKAEKVGERKYKAKFIRKIFMKRASSSYLSIQLKGHSKKNENDKFQRRTLTWPSRPQDSNLDPVPSNARPVTFF